MSYEFEYDDHSNPLYNFSPYFNIKESGFPPVFTDYSCLSPNNPTKFIYRSTSSTQITTFQYIYNGDGYPTNVYCLILTVIGRLNALITKMVGFLIKW